MMNEIVVMNVEMGHYPQKPDCASAQLLQLYVPACSQYSTDLSVSSCSHCYLIHLTMLQDKFVTIQIPYRIVLSIWVIYMNFKLVVK